MPGGDGYVVDRKGWECTKCGRVNSPDVRSCCQKTDESSKSDPRTVLNEVPKPLGDLLQEYKTDPVLLKKLSILDATVTKLKNFHEGN